MLGVFAAIVIVYVFVGHSIARLIRALSLKTTAFVKGDLTINFPNSGRNKVAVMGRVLQEMADNIRYSIKSLSIIARSDRRASENLMDVSSLASSGAMSTADQAGKIDRNTSAYKKSDFRNRKRRYFRSKYY
jgi:methyl-accepting chemotaxis protein